MVWSVLSFRALLPSSTVGAHRDKHLHTHTNMRALTDTPTPTFTHARARMRARAHTRAAFSRLRDRLSAIGSPVRPQASSRPRPRRRCWQGCGGPRRPTALRTSWPTRRGATRARSGGARESVYPGAHSRLRSARLLRAHTVPSPQHVDEPRRTRRAREQMGIVPPSCGVTALLCVVTTCAALQRVVDSVVACGATCPIAAQLYICDRCIVLFCKRVVLR